MSGPEDAGLLEAARAGDTEAVGRLLERHMDRVFAVCRRMVGPREAEDLTQEALIAVMRGLPRFDGRSAFSSWVYRIAVNVCLDELRRRGRRVTVDDGADAALLPDPVDGPDGSVADRLDLDAALARLRPEFRAVIVLRDVADLEYDEIARLLDLPPGTVRSRINRGRTALADLLSSGNLTDDPVVPLSEAGDATGAPSERT